MAELTPEEIEAAVRRGCRGLPEAVVQLRVDEALREMERIIMEECTIKGNIVHGSIEGGIILGTTEVKIEGNIGIFTPVVVWRD